MQDSASFALGWLADREDVAKAAWSQTGGRPVFQADVFRDSRPLPPAFSISKCIINWYNQGQIGSCFAVAAAGAMETATACAVLAGEPFEAMQLSRRFAWYEGRKRDGLIGSRGDGGTISGVMRALHEAGLPRESLAPYVVSRPQMDSKPSPEAYEDAKNNRLVGVMPFRFEDADAIKRTIFNGHPIVIGIWWPSGWDIGAIDQHGRTTGVTHGGFGHALYVVGWADADVFDDKYTYWHIVNSHGPIYPPLPKHWAARVPGYASARATKCYAFWARSDHLARVVGYGHAEFIAPAGVQGFKARNLLIGWEDMT